MSDLTRRELLQAGVVGISAAAVASTASGTAVTAQPESFHFDHVIGTSLDGWVQNHADEVSEKVLAEIERLENVFSVHNPASELSRLNSFGETPASSDFQIVMNLYQRWSNATGGALSPNINRLQEIWDHAVRTNRLPHDHVIQSESSNHSRQSLNLNSIAKGYILQRASEVAKSISHAGGMLNLGGDICTWGSQSLAVGITNPFAPFENAAPLTAIRLQNASIATSGSYMRGYQIDGRHFSHIIDPRTGRPADHIAQATVLAPDSSTANALATALCVLEPAEGIRLIESLDDVECLIIPAAGGVYRSSGFARYELTIANETTENNATADSWPADYQVTISLELPKISGGGRYRKPYVAVWIENKDEKMLRTITVWGNKPKWLPDLSGWWKLAKNDQDFVKTVTKATRSPGKYDLVWDGKDDKGKALPRGTYTVKVEVHREHGKHLFQSGKIACEADDATLTLEKNAESEAVVIKYGKKGDEKKPEEKKP